MESLILETAKTAKNGTDFIRLLFKVKAFTYTTQDGVAINTGKTELALFNRLDELVRTGKISPSLLAGYEIDETRKYANLPTFSQVCLKIRRENGLSANGAKGEAIPKPNGAKTTKQANRFEAYTDFIDVLPTELKQSIRNAIKTLLFTKDLDETINGVAHFDACNITLTMALPYNIAFHAPRFESYTEFNNVMRTALKFEALSFENFNETEREYLKGYFRLNGIKKEKQAPNLHNRILAFFEAKNEINGKKGFSESIAQTVKYFTPAKIFKALPFTKLDVQNQKVWGALEALAKAIDKQNNPIVLNKDERKQVKRLIRFAKRNALSNDATESLGTEKDASAALIVDNTDKTKNKRTTKTVTA